MQPTFINLNLMIDRDQRVGKVVWLTSTILFRRTILHRLF